MKAIDIIRAAFGKAPRYRPERVATNCRANCKSAFGTESAAQYSAMTIADGYAICDAPAKVAIAQQYHQATLRMWDMVRAEDLLSPQQRESDRKQRNTEELKWRLGL